MNFVSLRLVLPSLIYRYTDIENFLTYLYINKDPNIKSFLDNE